MAAPEQSEPLRFSNERKLRRQMRKRGWTDQLIREALRSPGIPTNGKHGAAMRYIHPRTRCHVVVDNKTGEIFHVGRKEFEYE